MNELKLNLTHRVPLKQIAAKFEMRSDFLISLLRSFGFKIKNENDILEEAHLKIISDVYVRVIKRYYRKSARDFSNLSNLKQKEIVRFFKHFIKNKDGEFFAEKLEETLIRDYFNNIVEDLSWRHFFDSFEFSISKTIYQPIDISLLVKVVEENEYSNIYRELNWGYSKILHEIFTDLRLQISTIIISSHYYIFSSEEDEFTALTSVKRCFSAVKKTLGEALTEIHVKLQPKWTKINYQKI